MQTCDTYTRPDSLIVGEAGCDRTWHCCGRWEEERSHRPGAEVEEGEAGHASKSEAWEGHYPQGVRYVGLSEEIGGNKLKDSLMFGDSHDVEDS